MSMPETAMNKKNKASTCKNDVWRTRQVLAVQTKSIAQPMKKGADLHLWASVLIAHFLH